MWLCQSFPKWQNLPDKQLLVNFDRPLFWDRDEMKIYNVYHSSYFLEDLDIVCHLWAMIQHFNYIFFKIDDFYLQ